MKAKTFIGIILLFITLISVGACRKIPYTPSAYAEITSVTQSDYEIEHAYLDTLGIMHPAVLEYGMVEIWYKVTNTGFGEIHSYTVLFAVLLDDGTYIYKEGKGFGITDYATCYVAIDTDGKQVRNVVITSVGVE